MTWHIVLWACLCSDVQTDLALLPDRCTHHDRQMVHGPAALDIYDGRGPVRTGHDCPEAPQDPRHLSIVREEVA